MACLIGMPLTSSARSRRRALSTIRASRLLPRRSNIISGWSARVCSRYERDTMTDRLADVGARIHGIRQLGAVVNAMRGIAAARAQQARGQLAAVDAYAATIAAAIGAVL